MSQAHSKPESKSKLKIKVLRRRVEELEGAIEDLKEYIAYLEEELRERDARIRELEGENWRLKWKVDELERELEELRSRARWW